MKTRIAQIDLLKFLAVLCIFNAHSTVIYPVCPWLATGGNFGDALFFFCSGYTLFLHGKEGLGRFDTWYKRRLSRIWPSVMAWAVIAGLLLNKNYSVTWTLVGGRGWFIQCILVFYILLWIIGRLFLKHMRIVLIIQMIISALILVYVSIINDHNPEHWKVPLFFPVMMFGAIMGMKTEVVVKSSCKDLICCFVSACLVTGATAVAARYVGVWTAIARVVLLMSILMFVYFAFRACSLSVLQKLRGGRIESGVRIVGGLCLDFYLVKVALISGRLNFLFPLNIPLMLIYLLLIAYVNRCVGRIIQQTFDAEKRPYDWPKVFALL